MMQFAEQFSDFEIVSPSATHLSWAHIVEVLPLKTQDAKLFYLSEASRGVIGRDKMRAMINRKVYERREIADTQITDTARVPQGAFKELYVFDFIGTAAARREVEVKRSLVAHIEKFLLELERKTRTKLLHLQRGG